MPPCPGYRLSGESIAHHYPGLGAPDAGDVHPDRRAVENPVHLAQEEQGHNAKGRRAWARTVRLFEDGPAEFGLHCRARSAAGSILNSIRAKRGGALRCANGIAQRREIGLWVTCHNINTSTSRGPRLPLRARTPAETRGHRRGQQAEGRVRPGPVLAARLRGLARPRRGGGGGEGWRRGKEGGREGGERPRIPAARDAPPPRCRPPPGSAAAFMRPHNTSRRRQRLPAARLSALPRRPPLSDGRRLSAFSLNLIAIRHNFSHFAINIG